MAKSGRRADLAVLTGALRPARPPRARESSYRTIILGMDELIRGMDELILSMDELILVG